MVLSDCYSWAKRTFGLAQLGDPRRTRRLVTLATSLARHTGLSVVKSSQSVAEVEGAYRLMRNPAVSPEAIADAGFHASARLAQNSSLLLALEDTTTINFSHQTAFDDLGNTTTSKHTRGLLAHSVLLFAPAQARVIGLIDQQRWSRDTGYATMADRAGASQDAPMSVWSVRSTPSGTATREIDLSVGGIHIPHTGGCPYGDTPQYRLRFTDTSL